jgi:hypothetical protein
MRGAGRHRRPHRHIGRPPRSPGAIAPEFFALFAAIAHARKRAYLAAYVQEGGDQVKARKTAGGGGQHCYWRRDDPEYRAAFERARLAVCEASERDVCSRAAPADNSDAALMSLMSRLRKERYGEGGNR